MELRIGDRNPVTGLYDVIWPDGGVTQNGVKIFNSEHQFGDVVLATQRSDGMMILDGVKATLTVATELGILKFGEQPVGYLNGQVWNEEEEILGTYVKIEVVVFRSPYVVTTGEPQSLGNYPVFVDPHLFIPGSGSVFTGIPPGATVPNILPNPFAGYDIFEPGVTTEFLYQSLPYELVLYRYYAGFFEPPVFVDMLYADFVAGQRPSWWVADDFQSQGGTSIVNEWFQTIRTTTVVSPPPTEFGAMAFYAEDASGSYWSNLPNFPGKVFPITSDGVHELQLDPSKFSGNEIIIHCVPISPPTSATFGLRTETIKRRQPYSFTASSPTPLAATSNTLTEEVLGGSPANSKTAFIVNYNKGTRQLA